MGCTLNLESLKGYADPPILLKPERLVYSLGVTKLIWLPQGANMNGQGRTMDRMNNQPGLLGDIFQSCFWCPNFPHSHTTPKGSPAPGLEPHKRGNVCLSN